MHPKPSLAEESALLALYERTWEEISRLREYEWKIAYGSVTLTAGFVAAINVENIRQNLTPVVRIFLTVGLSISAVLAVYYLVVTHRYLTEQRNIRRSLETVLGLFEPLGTEAVQVLPIKWKGQKVSPRFQRLELVVPLAMMLIAVQAFAIFVLWILPATS